MAMQRKAKAATETGLYLVILLGIVAVLNVISHGCGNIKGKYVRIDETRTERFTLSKGSARLLKSLKQPMEADVYVTRGLSKLDAFVRDLDDLLKEYEQAGGGNFRYRIIEAKTDEQKKAAKDAGLQAVAFGQDSETKSDTTAVAQGYMGIVFKYGSEKNVIPILSPDRTEGLEFWITNKIRELRDKADDIKHRIGVISDKKGVSISDSNLIAGQQKGPSLKSIMERAFPFYKFEDVDLKGGDTEIDQGLVGLIITQPGHDYTDKELRRIDQFVMRGRSLLVVASAANLKASDATMKAALNLHNLDKLLTGYGVEVHKNVALDWGTTMHLAVMTQTGVPAQLILPGIAQLQHIPGLGKDQQMIDNSFAGFFRLEELVFPYPSSLTVHPDKQPGAKLRVVARTSPRTSLSTDDPIDLRPSLQISPKGKLAAQPIAAVVEGKLKRAMPEGKDDIKVPAESKDTARVLVIASSEFLENPFARAGKGPDLGPQFAMMGNIGGDEQLQQISQPYAQRFLTATILAFKNSLDWMAGDSDLIAVSAKILGEPNLTYADIKPAKFDANNPEAAKKELERVKTEREKTQKTIEWILTLLLPLLFAGLGVGYWRLRETKRAELALD